MKHKFYRNLAVLATGAFLAAAPSVSAAPQPLNIGLNSSKYMSVEQPILRVAVGNPEIATIVQLPSSKKDFLLVAKKAGTTTLFIWTTQGEMMEYIVAVSPEDPGLAGLIEKAIGLRGVHVKMVGGKVLLTGTVENQYERNYAVRIAQLYVDDSGKDNLTVGSNVDMRMNTEQTKRDNGDFSSRTIGGSENRETERIIDLLHMLHPSQIRLEAQVISINPESQKDIGVLYGSGDQSSLFSSPNVFYAGQTYNNSGTPLLNKYGNINVALQALVMQNKARILSRPNITTMSGEEAIIQVGGEIPYTNRDSNGNPTTKFKDYGIILQFKPSVDAEGRIVSSIHTEISMPSGDTVDDQPILDRRRADAVVTVPSGSTMVIGGLLDSRDYKTVRKFPLLGDIPIIGEFFKYTSKTKNKQELIVLVTPYLVDEDEMSRTRMSEEMHKYYDQGEQERKSQENVDLNPPVEVDTSGSDTFLNRYLDREVLPKPAEKSKKKHS